MTHQDIIKLAMEYGFTGGFDPDGNLTHDATFVEAVKEAVRREREECKKCCTWKTGNQFVDEAIAVCYRAIDQRGEE